MAGAWYRRNVVEPVHPCALSSKFIRPSTHETNVTRYARYTTHRHTKLPQRMFENSMILRQLPDVRVYRCFE